MRKAVLVVLLVGLLGVSGCAFLFGEAKPVLDENGVALVNDDGTPVLQYTDGIIGKAARTVAPLADAVPYGSAGTGVLALIAAIGAAIQTARARGKVKPDDVRKMIDDLKPAVDEIGKDEDLGDLVAAWEPDSELAKKLKAAWLKNKAKK